MNARPMLRLGLLAIVAFVIGLVAARWLLSTSAPPPPVTENATVLQPPRSITALDLLDEDARPFTTDSLRDQWTVVFFGFTYCPDVCPATLTTLAQMNRQLTDLPPAERPRVMLFTVDPERDTAERLKAYVQFFDPGFGAATGTLPAVEQAAAAFAIPFAKVPLAEGGYTMDHGAGVFFVGPDGNVHAYSSPPLRADTLARDYRKVVRWFGETRG